MSKPISSINFTIKHVGKLGASWPRDVWDRAQRKTSAITEHNEWRV